MPKLKPSLPPGGRCGDSEAARQLSELLECARSLQSGQRRVERLLDKLANASGAVPRSTSVERREAFAEIGSDASASSERLPWNELCDVPAPEKGSSKTRDGRVSDTLTAVCVRSPGRKSTTKAGFARCTVRTQALLGGHHCIQNLQLRKDLKGTPEELDEAFSTVGLTSTDTTDLLTESSRVLSAPTKHKKTRRRMRRCFPVLLPHSITRLVFDLLSLVVLSYELIAVPALLAFPSDGDIVLWLSYVAIVFWVSDMAICFRTGFYAQGELYMQGRLVAVNYIRGAFWFDFLTLATDVFALVARATVKGSGADASKFVRIFKIARFIKLIGVVRMHRVRSIFQRWSGPQLGPWLKTLVFLLQTVKGVLFLLWLCHLVACLWCFMAIQTPFVSDTGFSWINLNIYMDGRPGEQQFDSFGTKFLYTTAFQWAMTQMVCGSMEVFAMNTAERIFTIVCLLVGLWVVSSFISASAAAVTQFSMESRNHTKIMSDLNTFLERANVSRQLRLSVFRQVDARLTDTAPLVVKDLDVLSKLSLSLRNELQKELCDPHLMEHPFFNVLSMAARPAWEETCRAAVIFSALGKGDCLFLSGRLATGMHFITKGKISYSLSPGFTSEALDRSESGRSLAAAEPGVGVAVPPGQWLSEAALWCDWKHAGSAEVVDKPHCEVLSLDTTNFLKIFNREPVTALLMWSYGRSFHACLKRSADLEALPNDLDLQFGLEEVVASMPRSVMGFLGQVILETIASEPDAFPSISEELISEMTQGLCTLLVTRSGGLARCIPTVQLYLTRENGGQVLACIECSKRGSHLEASCALPEGRQEVGQDPNDCFRHLLDTKFKPLAEGMEVHEMERACEWTNPRRSDVRTRYVRTVIQAEWNDEADEALEAFLLEEEKRWKPSLVMVKTRSSATAVQKTISGRFSGPRGSALSEVPGVENAADVFLFPDRSAYAWLTHEEFAHFSSQAGQRALIEWMLALELLEQSAGA